MNNENRTPHWIPCPVCNEKTDVKIYEDTVLVKFVSVKSTLVKELPDTN